MPFVLFLFPFSSFTRTIERKLQSNCSTLQNSYWDKMKGRRGRNKEMRIFSSRCVRHDKWEEKEMSFDRMWAGLARVGELKSDQTSVESVHERRTKRIFSFRPTRQLAKDSIDRCSRKRRPMDMYKPPPRHTSSTTSMSSSSTSTTKTTTLRKEEEYDRMFMLSPGSRTVQIVLTTNTVRNKPSNMKRNVHFSTFYISFSLSIFSCLSFLPFSACSSYKGVFGVCVY